MKSPQKRIIFLVSIMMALVAGMVNIDEARAQSRDSYARWQATAPTMKAIDIPVQIGVGPVGNIIGTPNLQEFRLGGPIVEDQLFHTGLKISLTAVIDRELVRQNPELVPRQYRAQIEQMGEVRVSPLVLGLIPSSLLISPKWNNTGIFGSTWRLLSVGLAPISDPIRVGASAGLIGTYAYIYSDLFDATHFLRPGLDVALDIEIPLTKEFLMSFGWVSQFYIPQRVGGSILEIPLGQSDTIWHMGQLYLQFHLRVPYTIYRQVPRRS